MEPADEDREIVAIIERLEKQFPAVPSPVVALVVREAQSAFHESPIQNYVPVLVEGDARRRLRNRSPIQ